jgi:predicted outer membrane repeat protein
VVLLTFSVGCAPTIGGDNADDKAVPGPDDGDDGGGDSDDGTGNDDDTGPDDPGPQDADGDGFTEDEDCDDTDGDINPDAEEEHDGVDNDCDDYVDEVDVCEDGVGVLQAAIDDASDGATLLLCAGSWSEQLVVDGRELTIIGLEGAEQTTVDAEGNGRTLSVTGRSDLTVQGLTLRDGTGDVGGVVACDRSDLVLVESVVTGGQADDGGGIGASDCDLNVVDTVVSQNAATRFGGGLFTTGSSGELVRTTLDGNTAYEGGGAFTYDGDFDITDSTFSANEATTVAEDDWGPGGGGGGLWSAGGEVTGTSFIGNTSTYHAGGAYFYRGRPTFTGNTVDNNYCGEDGAGIYFNISTATISGNVFRDNEAYDDAGGLRLYYGSSRIENNEFYGNSAGDDGGGAKFSHSEHVFNGNYMEGNSTGDAGGGLELDNDSTHVYDNVFVDNTANRGAGLHNWRTERRFTIEDSEFIGNKAGDCGGGLQFDNSPYVITVKNLWLEGNEGNDGAALCVDRVYRDPEDVGGVEDYFQDTLLDIHNVVFSGNDASDDGGAVYVRAGSVDIANVVMDDNEGPGAAAIAVKGATVTLMNSIVSENSGGAALYVEDTEDGPGSLTATYSDFYRNSSIADGIEDPRGSNGNIDENPDFDSGAGDYSLQSSSPCINAGNPSVSDTDGSRSDMGFFGGPGAP